MQTFLAQAAAFLLENHPGDSLAALTVVVPTRRARVYLQDELRRALPPDAVQLAPRIYSMEDYVARRADVRLADELTLQLQLFDVLREFQPKLTFDEFSGWGPTLLADFSNLDQNLADPARLFDYLSEARALERWELSAGTLPENSVAREAFRFWNILERVYECFKQRLAAAGVAYPGLAYRWAAERVTAAAREDPRRERFHYFLGLGLLSRAEEQLIRALRKAERADVRFDGDAFYLGTPDSPRRAGQYLRAYQSRLGIGPAQFSFGESGPPDLLRTHPRAVQVLGVANRSLQGKVAGQLVAAHLRAFPTDRIAVVLPDETLLLPVLYGLPPEAVPRFNVTMGLSFQSTPLFNLVDLLFETHLTGVRLETGETEGVAVRRYHHLTVTKLLAHPLLRRYQQWLATQPGAPPQLLNAICQRITERNAVLVSETDLRAWGQHHPLVESLFRPWHHCDDVIRALLELVELLRRAYSPEPTAIEGEYLYLFFTLVNRLASAFDGRADKPSVRSFRRFLQGQMRATRLPFLGEPIAQVQVMGLLETRALDFDHVVVLSCNEGTLPAAKRHNSLLPFDLLKEFGLPTYQDQEAATAHQFWRLLQRARQVELLYVQPSDSQPHDRSRFLLQLQHDLLPETLGRTRFADRPVVLGPAAVVAPLPTTRATGDLVIDKHDPAVQQALREALTSGLSPTAFNDFVKCSLRFYFRRVGKFREQDEVAEELSTLVLGNAVHKVLEILIRPLAGRRPGLTAADVADWPTRASALFANELQPTDGRQAPPDEGLNHLQRQVTHRHLLDYLNRLHAELATSGPLEVLAVEARRFGTVYVDLEQGERLAVRLIGRVDRIDRLPDGRIRIVDYKTGKVESKDLKLQKARGTPEEAVNRLLTDPSPEADKVRQLWFYRLMQAETEAGQAGAGAERAGAGEAGAAAEEVKIEAAIVSLRNAAEAYVTADLSFLELPEQSFHEASAQALGQLVQRLLDPGVPIQKTDDPAHCELCDFRRVCGR